MQYQLDLLLDVKDVNLSLSDRSGNNLVMDIAPEGNLVKVSTKVFLPNLIRLGISKTTDNGSATLESVWLGNVKFNKNALHRTFVYRHEYGENRSPQWEFNGNVEFEFFEYTAIKYHLLMGTRI